MPRFNEWMLAIAICVVIFVTTFIDSNHTYFFNPFASGVEIARYTALLGIFALGATVVIISGGIDLSTGSTIAFSATVCGAVALVVGDFAVKPVQDRLEWARTDSYQKLVVPVVKEEEAAVEALKDRLSRANTEEEKKQTQAEIEKTEAEFASRLSKLEAEIESSDEVIGLKQLIDRRRICVALLGIATAISSGFLIGTLHAWLITSLRLPPFIATLATLVGLRSLARILCDGVTAPRNLVRAQINVNDPVFRYLNAHVWVQLAVFVSLALFTAMLLRWTLLGRHIYALGGNEQAARLSGIRTNNVKWFAYCFASVTASIAGIFVMAQELVAAPVNQGRGYELNAIAAAVVGGCSLQGGVGTVFGTFLGALFLRLVIDSVAKIIKSGADMYEGLIVGSVVVAAVTITQLQQLWSSGRELFPGALGLCSIFTISALASLFAFSSGGTLVGMAVGLGFGILLSAVKIAEVVRANKL